MTSILLDEKKQIREQAHNARNALEEKDALSERICRKLMQLPQYKAAKAVLFYIDVRSEVRTRHCLPEALTQAKKIAVPYCVEKTLELFHLTDLAELSLGKFKILEPKVELRALPVKRVDISEIDLIVVPGVAFDREGARMGHGFGFYDRLLENARPDAAMVALAFECQLFPKIPVQPHDVFMDFVITEQGMYKGKGRG